MNQLKNITKHIINVLCVLLFIILLLVIYAKVKVSFTNDKVNANYFGYRIFEIASGSMEPTLKQKDVILVNVKDKDVKKDDIIAYIGENDAVITHRVIMVNGDSLIVKGDANNTVDSPIKKDQVIGTMVKVYPKLGVWKRILTEPKIILLIFVTLLLFDAALSYDDKKDKKEKEEIKPRSPKEEKELDKEIKKDIKEIETEGDKELLEFTRQIDINEVKDLLDKQKKAKENEEIELLSDTTEYTIRLDLKNIQNNIKKKR